MKVILLLALVALGISALPAHRKTPSVNYQQWLTTDNFALAQQLLNQNSELVQSLSQQYPEYASQVAAILAQFGILVPRLDLNQIFQSLNVDQIIQSVLTGGSLNVDQIIQSVLGSVNVNQILQAVLSGQVNIQQYLTPDVVAIIKQLIAQNSAIVAQAVAAFALQYPLQALQLFFLLAQYGIFLPRFDLNQIIQSVNLDQIIQSVLTGGSLNVDQIIQSVLGSVNVNQILQAVLSGQINIQQYLTPDVVALIKQLIAQNSAIVAQAVAAFALQYPLQALQLFFLLAQYGIFLPRFDYSQILQTVLNGQFNINQYLSLLTQYWPQIQALASQYPSQTSQVVSWLAEHGIVLPRSNYNQLLQQLGSVDVQQLLSQYWSQLQSLATLYPNQANQVIDFLNNHGIVLPRID